MIFIAGRGRSGSTLLVSLFDGHPEVLSIVNESAYFGRRDIVRKYIDDVDQYFLHTVGQPYDHAARSKLPHGTRISGDENWRPLTFWKAICERSDDPAKEEEAIKAAIRTKDEKRIFLALVDTYKRYFWDRTEEPRYVLEKTPGNEYALDTLLGHFPDCRVIHLVRDPFDNVESFVARRGKIDPNKVNPRTGVANSVFGWRRSLRVAAAARRRHPGNYCIVRFEDLISDPENTMRKLADFLGIGFDPILVRPTSLSGRSEWGSNSHRTDVGRSDFVNPVFLDKDAACTFDDRMMRTIAACVGADYDALGWRKYKRHVDARRGKDLLLRQPEENAQHVLRRIVMATYFGSQPIGPAAIQSL